MPEVSLLSFLAIVVPVAVALVEYWRYRHQPKVQHGEAAERVSQASARYVEMVDTELKELRAENRQLEEKVSALHHENEVLSERVNTIDLLYSELGLRLESEMKLRRSFEVENEGLKRRVTELETEVQYLRNRLDNQ